MGTAITQLTTGELQASSAHIWQSVNNCSHLHLWMNNTPKKTSTKDGE